MPPPVCPPARPTAAPRRRTRFAACLLAAFALLVAACGIDEEVTVPTPTTSSTSTTVDGNDRQDPPETTEDPFEVEDLPEDRYELFAEDVQDWWGTELNETTGTDYDPLADSSVLDASETGDLPTCEGREIPIGVVEGNALAAPCPEGTIVIYDGEGLFAGLEENFGPIGPGIVFAHEFAHVVQFQLNDTTELESRSTVVLEQQADCLAGAWLNHFLDDPGDELEGIATADPLDASIGAILSFRDPAGTNVENAGAHGSGFDRVRALQEGFEEPPAGKDRTEVCFDYLTDGADSLPLVDLDLSRRDLATGGDARLGDLVGFVIEDLNRYYPEVIEGFDTPARSEVTSDRAVSSALEEYYTLGDAASATVLALVWADEAQSQLGLPTEGDDARLQRACMTGGWLANIILRQRDDPDSGDLRLSPGDLDETIAALVKLSETNDMAADGTAFELVDELRRGVIDGFQACDVS